jgi:hypothetical protein
MQVFVRRDCSVIAAPVQCDVDGVPKGSHFARVPAAKRSETADKVSMLVGIGGNPSNVRSSAVAFTSRRQMRAFRRLIGFVVAAWPQSLQGRREGRPGWCSTIRCTGKVWSKSTTPGQPRGIRRAGADLSVELPAIRPVRAQPNRPCPDVGARHEETDAHARSSVWTTSNSSLTSRWPARGHGKASAASSVAGQEQT